MPVRFKGRARAVLALMALLLLTAASLVAAHLLTARPAEPASHPAPSGTGGAGQGEAGGAGEPYVADMGRWLCGITVDDSWYDDVDLEAVLAAIRDMPVRPTVRIVMSHDLDAEAYEPLFSQVHEMAFVMACPVDSSDMGLYEDEAAYLERFRDAFRVLAPYTDLWEVGNEINGVEWIGQEPETIVGKVEAANGFIRSQGAPTALTMYYARPEDQDLFRWMADHLPEGLRAQVDYALISYYEDDNEGYLPDWDQVFPSFEAAFSGAKVGIGECGNTAGDATEASKAAMARSYYAMDGPSDHFVGGFFWWNWVQDCVPHEGSAVYDEINRAMTVGLM